MQEVVRLFDSAARNAEKAAARAADAAHVASGAMTWEQVARANAFLPYTIDVSQWTVVFDSLVDGDEDFV